ncbi:MAG: thioredoxin family protein [Flavobacteriaceae bacterium]|nr:thioredoxin family protein [Flavobacteriaceae bacterium]MCY4266751.1 thioredoxin family protein [Flavobacteriaceae bacterium]MCY4297765.1 thioredoxin family protein [Flavobacteriaceae bacterium]
MALTESNMLSLGVKAPSFSLPNVVSGKTETFDDLKGEKGTLIIFMCNHCPYVIHILDQFVAWTKKYQSKGINTIGISSNNIKTHPADSPSKMRELSIVKNFSFPYLYDDSQQVAKHYDAACTPDLYLFNGESELVYRGCFDKSRPGNDVEVTGEDLSHAANHLLLGKPISQEQTPSIGCNIKWK